MSKLRSDELVNMEGDGSPSFPYGATSTEPTLNNHVATKSYVDNVVANNLGNVVSLTAPANPVIGNFWTDTSVSPSALKVWNGSVWLELIGEVAQYSGIIGSPVEVSSPVDGIGVGGAYNYYAVSDTVTSKGDPFLLSGAITSSQLGEEPEEIRTLAYGNGRYVAITYGPGSNHQMVVRYSDDEGLTWTQAPFPSMSSVYKMIFNGTNFVAVGSGDNMLVYSPDGIVWSVASGDIGDAYYDLAFDPSSGRIVAVGNYLSYHSTQSSTYTYSGGRSSVLYSDDDGATWSRPNLTSGTNGTTNIKYHSHRSVAYGNGLWVTAPGYEAKAMYSTDGINWYASDFTYGTYQISPVVYDDTAQRFICIIHKTDRTNSYFATTYNGSSWSSDYLPMNSNMQQGDARIDSIAAGDGNIITGFQKSRTEDMYFFIFNDAGNWNTHYMSFYRDQWNNYYYPVPRRVFYINNRFIITTGGRSNSDLLIFFAPGDRPWQSSSQHGTLSYSTSYSSLAEVTVASENVFNNTDGSVIPDVTFAEAFSSGGTELTDGFGNPSTNSYSMYSYGDYQTSGTTSYVSAGGSYYSNLDVGERLRKQSEATVYGPSPSDVVFTSKNANSAAVTATDATVAFRKWTLETRASSSDPWTVVTEADDYDIAASQDGSTPWSGAPALQPNTLYRVKVSYYSTEAKEVESAYTTFETGPAS